MPANLVQEMVEVRSTQAFRIILNRALLLGRSPEAVCG
jgi:hypothetical protein